MSLQNVPQSFFQLPVAPCINSRVRFLPLTLTKEKHLLPGEAKTLFASWKEQGGTADGVLLFGPGDPLASIENTIQTAEAIKEIDNNTALTVRTLGIGGEKYADRLAKAGVTKVEIIINGINSATVEKIYAWIRPEFKTLKLEDGAKILLEEQHKAIPAFKDAGMEVQVITTCYPENNSDSIAVIARTVNKLGADSMTVVPYQASEDADIDLPEPSMELMKQLEDKIASHISLSKVIPICTALDNTKSTTHNLKPTKERPNVAVASSNGMDIDMHLGHASTILIYGPREDGLSCLLETRTAPPKGGGAQRWDALANLLPDCFIFLAASAGDSPRKALAEKGVPVQICDSQIDPMVDQFYSTGKKGKGKSR